MFLMKMFVWPRSQSAFGAATLLICSVVGWGLCFHDGRFVFACVFVHGRWRFIHVETSINTQTWISISLFSYVSFCYNTNLLWYSIQHVLYTFVHMIYESHLFNTVNRSKSWPKKQQRPCLQCWGQTWPPWCWRWLFGRCFWALEKKKHDKKPGFFVSRRRHRSLLGVINRKNLWSQPICCIIFYHASFQIKKVDSVG